MVTIRYTDIGTTTVSPPAWYDSREGAPVSTAEAAPETTATTETNATVDAGETTSAPGPTPTADASTATPT
jgi:hypothetical protein